MRDIAAEVGVLPGSLYAHISSKETLLDEIVDYILKRGLGNLTLRPLAAALKTSPRMLIYFFGSKEQLITEALTQCRVRQQQEFARILSTRGNRRQRLAFAWAGPPTIARGCGAPSGLNFPIRC